MFREFKEYQDILKLYQNNVYQSNEDIIKEAFASEEFTKEESVFIEENFDALIEEVIAEEEESLSEQMTGRQRQKIRTQKANEIISDLRKPTAKITSVPSSTIQGKADGAFGKFKSALGKVGSKIGNVAKTATAPLKSGQGAGKMVGKGAKLLSKMGPAGKAAAVATLAGGAIAAGLASRNKKPTVQGAQGRTKRPEPEKPMPTTAEIRAKDKAAGGTGMSNIPSKEGNAVIGGKKLNPDFGKKVEIKKEPEISKFTKQGKERTPAQMAAAKRIGSGTAKNPDTTIAQVKKSNEDSMKARAKERFAAFKAKRAEKKAAMVAKEELTPYDYVLEYLLSSEQAATIEEANYVMTEMDAETIQAIVKEGSMMDAPDDVKSAAKRQYKAGTARETEPYTVDDKKTIIKYYKNKKGQV